MGVSSRASFLSLLLQMAQLMMDFRHEGAQRLGAHYDNPGDLVAAGPSEHKRRSSRNPAGVGFLHVCLDLGLITVLLPALLKPAQIKAGRAGRLNNGVTVELRR